MKWFHRRRSYLVAYAHERGFGRIFMEMSGPVTWAAIREWEAIIVAKGEPQSAAVLSFQRISGHVRPQEGADQ